MAIPAEPYRDEPYRDEQDEHGRDERDARDEVRREVVIEASPEEVWEAIATESGRERWLEPDPARELQVEVSDEPKRMVWWWWHEHESPRRVELEIVAAPAGSRVTVIESTPSAWGAPLGLASTRRRTGARGAHELVPRFPLDALASSFTLALV